MNVGNSNQEETAVKWGRFISSAALAAMLALPGYAAQPAPASANADAFTYEQYRDWRLAYMERRRSEIAVALAAPDLSAERKARLDKTKAYYDWLAGLPAAERDRRFRERFDRIDANHDGRIDPDERTTWRDKQRAFYHRREATAAPSDAEPH